MNDTQLLMHILGLRRPAHSMTEQLFVDLVLGERLNPKFDSYGNLWVTVPGDNTTLFSCHTDTVSKDDGSQLVIEVDGIVRLVDGKPGQSLGADDGAGIWLMIQMIEAKVPGIYVFHRDEEIGGRGSRYIADREPERLAKVERAIAFDRRGTTDVITHQAGGRCASDEFALALSEQLGMGYRPCSGGIFTDTANYIRLIPECTNISVGYENEHGPRETLDLKHLLALRDRLLKVEWSTLPTVRDPKVVELRQYTLPLLNPDEDMTDAIRDRADAVALLLEDMGIHDVADLHAALDELEWEITHVG